MAGGKSGNKYKHPGQPTKYDSEYHPDKAYSLGLLGLIDKDIADVFSVCESTLDNWKRDYPEFLRSIKKGKQAADGNTAKSLYQRANGYSHKDTKFFQYEGRVIREETIKHYPPDPVSMIFWLKNRQPKLWRDKQEIHNTGDVILHIDKDDADL